MRRYNAALGLPAPLPHLDHWLNGNIRDSRGYSDISKQPVLMKLHLKKPLVGESYKDFLCASDSTLQEMRPPPNSAIKLDVPPISNESPEPGQDHKATRRVVEFLFHHSRHPAVINSSIVH